MGKLVEINGKFYESEYENAFIEYLIQEGWQHLQGDNISRESQSEVIYKEDLKKFLSKNAGFTDNDLFQLVNKIRLIGDENDFSTLHKMYTSLVDGIKNFKPEHLPKQDVKLIDFDNPHNNIFRCVNQFTVEYKNNGNVETRRPDILLYVNGIPLCIIELKNPSDFNTTINDAWKQIYVRYWRDIPHLLHYCPLACISDGVRTRLGTVRTKYEHFYSWRRINDSDKVSRLPYEELISMIKGVYSPARFLEIFRDYIYFQDSNYDNEEREIVCRYPQFFATRLLKNSIIKSVKEKTGKGGTYFGATGCGKTYTMAFLARQLALRCENIIEMGSPTIVMIVDRDELQNQGAKLFTKSTEFLNLGSVATVASRKILREELGSRQSGGFYICTIQKFCDRKDDKIGLINDRRNIICFSDEAHRTQIERAKNIRFSQDADENMKALVSKPYAKVLKEAFPNATFVGFTGTPIAETYQTFGDEVDRYTMDQAVADGLTVNIKYHPRIAKVIADSNKIKLIEKYYKDCQDEGVDEQEIAKSKKAMSSIDVILGDADRLDKLSTDIHDHYTKSCNEDPTRVQKAMIVCSNRQIAYKLLLQFKEKYPDWFELKKTSSNTYATREEIKELKEMPFIAMVASVGKNDPKDMYEYLGGTKNDVRSSNYDAMFKNDKSNFHIVIVVDMWITGFDVPSLTYLYNDKPLQKHILIQTISRVNRKYPGKDFGMVIDYIGIRDQMRQAVKLYGGDSSVALTKDDVNQALKEFKNELEILKNCFKDYDLSPFLKADNGFGVRYETLAHAAEHVFISNEEFNIANSNGKTNKVSFKKYFLATVKKLRAAYAICLPSNVLTDIESNLAQCFMSIAGIVRKMSGTSTDIDSDIMNTHVSKMIEAALKYNKVESILDFGETETIFDPKFIEKLKNVKMPATKLEILIRLLRKEIKEYSRTNKIAASKFEELLDATINAYHERRKSVSVEEATEMQQDATEKIIESATDQAINILNELKKDKDSFRKMELTFEEKAIYDILIAQRNQYQFEYGTDEKIDGIIINNKCRILAKKIKEIIDSKSSYADWLNNQNIRNQLKLEIQICLAKNAYPPVYTPMVYPKVIEQVENFKKFN